MGSTPTVLGNNDNMSLSEKEIKEVKKLQEKMLPVEGLARLGQHATTTAHLKKGGRSESENCKRTSSRYLPRNVSNHGESPLARTVVFLFLFCRIANGWSPNILKNMMHTYAAFHGYLHLHIALSMKVWSLVRTDSISHSLISINNVCSGAKFGVFLDQAQISAKLKGPPIFLFSLVEANQPNLIPAKFSGYTVL